MVPSLGYSSGAPWVVVRRVLLAFRPGPGMVPGGVVTVRAVPGVLVTGPGAGALEVRPSRPVRVTVRRRCSGGRWGHVEGAAVRSGGAFAQGLGGQACDAGGGAAAGAALKAHGNLPVLGVSPAGSHSSVGWEGVMLARVMVVGVVGSVRGRCG